MIHTIDKAQKADIARLVSLAHSLKMSVAGCSSPYLFRKLIEDDEVVKLAGRSDDGAITGYVLALIDPARYWKRLCWRRPLLTVRILFDRIRLKRRQAEGHKTELPQDIITSLDFEDRQEHWGESGPNIAQILFIGTHPASRGAGIARKLYHECFEELRKRGVTRVDAHVSSDNLASLRLHLATGWHLHYRIDHVFATRQLPALGADSIVSPELSARL